MAYETTYSSLLADQEDLASQYIQFDQEAQDQSDYDVDLVDTPYESSEENIPDDYEMYKNFYEENQAKDTLEEDDNDLSFMDFVFEGDNKYKSFKYSETPQYNFAGNVSSQYASSGSLKDNISKLESGGNYKAEALNSSAKGKYQFIWSIHNKDIAKVTGVRSSQEFLNNPEAQEKYFNYWDQTTLTPSAKANLSTFRKYYPNATEDDVKRATHFAGRGNFEKALKTGNFTQPLDENKTSISKYVYGNKKAYGGYGDDRRQSKSESTNVQRPYNTLAISPNYAGRENLSGLSASPNIKKIELDEENKRQLALRKKQGYTTGTGKAEPVYPEMLAFPGTPAIKGIGKLGNIAVDAINPVGGLRNGAGHVAEEVVSKSARNLEDLNYAKNFYSKYKYDIPSNLDEIAQSDELTDATIQKLVNQHNTFTRGVSTNWDKVNPVTLQHLADKGIDYSTNPEAAARYMATHVPINTGYGRASLPHSIERTGRDAIYTSNSKATAEGYTYGDGYIVDVKRPTDFNSSNRKDWVDKNQVKYYEKEMPDIVEDEDFYKYSKEQFKKTHDKDVSDAQSIIDQHKLYAKLAEKPENYVQHHKLSKDLEETYPHYKESGYYKLNTSLPNNYLPSSLRNLYSDITGKGSGGWMQKTKQDVINDIYYQEEYYRKRLPEAEEIINTNFNDKFAKRYTQEYDKNILRTERQEGEDYAHYIHVGRPGEKLLEDVSAERITPEMWENKSRAHIGRYSPGYSAAAIGGLGILGVANQEKKQYGGKVGKLKFNKK